MKSYHSAKKHYQPAIKTIDTKQQIHMRHKTCSTEESSLESKVKCIWDGYSENQRRLRTLWVVASAQQVNITKSTSVCGVNGMKAWWDTNTLCCVQGGASRATYRFRRIKQQSLTRDVPYMCKRQISIQSRSIATLIFMETQACEGDKHHADPGQGDWSEMEDYIGFITNDLVINTFTCHDSAHFWTNTKKRAKPATERSHSWFKKM